MRALTSPNYASHPYYGLNQQAEGENAATPPGVPVPYPSFGMGGDTASGEADQFEFEALSENAASSRLPSHTPEWTDHNPSDPGIIGSSVHSGTYFVKEVEHTIDAERLLDGLSEPEDFTLVADSLV